MAKLNGKKAVVAGIADERSLAFGCAQYFRAACAELAIDENIASVDASNHVVA